MRNLRMKIARIASRISQDQIAATLNIDQSRVSRIENGFIKPRKEEKREIAQLLDADPRNLFPDEN